MHGWRSDVTPNGRDSAPAFYGVPAKAYEALMDRLEDLELDALAERLITPQVSSETPMGRVGCSMSKPICSAI